MCYITFYMMQLPEIDSLTQLIHSTLWPTQNMYHFVYCTSESFTVACFPYTSTFFVAQSPRLIQQLYLCVFGIYGNMPMTKDLLFEFQLPSFSLDSHQINMNTWLGTSLKILIYTSKCINLGYHCLLQKYKEFFKTEQFGAVFHLSLLTMHPSKCSIILWKDYCW